MTEHPGETPEDGWIPSERPVPPHKNSRLWIAFQVVVVLLPPAGLTLAALAAALIQLGLFFSGDLAAIPWGIIFAVLAVVGGRRVQLQARKIRLMILGWEPAEDRGLLLKLGALAGAFAVLAGFFIMKMGELMRTPDEKATRGSLGALRSALSIYYGNMEGQYPDDLGALTVGAKYLPKIPQAKTPMHHRASAKFLNGPAPDDSGGWHYNNAALDPNAGTVRVNCTHTDVKGSVWDSY